MMNRRHRRSAANSEAASLPLLSLPYETRDLGVTVIGKTGFGKTTALEHFIRADIDRGTAALVFDVQGDLSEQLLQYAAATGSGSKVRVLDIDPHEFQRPYGLNLYECLDIRNPALVERTLGTVLAFFAKMWGSDLYERPLISQGLRHTARTIIANPGYTMREVPLLYANSQFRERLLRNMSEEEDTVHLYWETYSRLPKFEDRQDLSGAIINKVDEFLSNQIVNRIVSQGWTTVNLNEAMNEGYCLLLRIPFGEIGERTAEVIGSLFLSQVADFIFARVAMGLEDRPRVHLYLDEYGRFASEQTSFLLKEGRKYNVGTTIACQTLADLRDDFNRAAALQTGHLVVFRSIGDDGQQLAKQFRVAPEPQWEEKVEEVEGTEPVLSFARKPIEHLLSASHQNAGVRELTRSLLVPIEEKRRSLEGRAKAPHTSNFDYINWEGERVVASFSNASTLQSNLMQLEQHIAGCNGLLVSVMDKRISLDSNEFYEELAKALVNLQDAWYSAIPRCFTPPRDWQRQPNQEWPSYQVYRDQHIAALVELLNPALGREPVALLSTNFPLHVADFRRARWCARMDDVIQANMKKDRPYMLVKLRTKIKDERDALLTEIEKASEKAQTLGNKACELFGILAREPILVRTGQERPRTRVRYITHPQRTYQDVQTELGVKLANLPPFTPYCQLTLPSGQTSQGEAGVTRPRQVVADESTVAKIKKVSSQLYGRPWSEVQAEIRARQSLSGVGGEQGKLPEQSLPTQMQRSISRRPRRHPMP